MDNSNNKTSLLISSQVPQFVKDDHETFVNFLEDYYKFLEQDGQLSYVQKNFLRFLDIDNINQDIKEDALFEGHTEEGGYHSFLQKMYDNFIALIPAKVLADRTLILKHAKDFYRARGSEKSVRFLLRILFNKEISFYYPRQDVLKASDGKWYIETAIRVGNIQVNNVSNTSAATKFVSKQIIGETSNTTAIVEFVDTFYDKGKLVTELKISNFDREFSASEIVHARYEENGEEKFLSGRLYSGSISYVSLIDGGVGYTLGEEIPIEGDGANAKIIVSRVTKGSLTSIGVLKPGAGFKVDDNIFILGGGGDGANGRVSIVDLSNKYHPNTYQIVADQIYLEANTPIGNTIYANLKPEIIDPANNWIANSMHYWAYANCGPVLFAELVREGEGYTSMPVADIQSNTAVRSLGIVGRMEIRRGGVNYQVGDTIEFDNPYGSFGTGAYANVTNVAANGMITSVNWVTQPGHFPGGEGYNQATLPLARVVSGTGSNAYIEVVATIGDGEQLIESSTTFGTILEIKVIAAGDGFTYAPLLNLANMSTGSNASALAYIVQGTYVYPGRYLNDDGHLSSYNFLEDRDYYQNYSYVVKIDEPISKYRKPLKDLTHPAGMKLFGQYDFVTNNSLNVRTSAANTINSKMVLSEYYVNTNDVTKSGSYNVKTLVGTYEPYIGTATFNIMPTSTTTYGSRNSRIYVKSFRHSYKSGQKVFLKFNQGYANIVNGLYTVVMANTNYFSVDVVNGNTNIITPKPNTSNLVLSSGSGNTVSFINVSYWVANSNNKFDVGDTLNVRGNLVSVVYASQNSATFAVFPAVSGNISGEDFIVLQQPYPANGNVIIYDPKIRINYSDKRQTANASVYLKFQTDDTTYENTFYEVTTANSVAFSVQHSNIANAIVKNGLVRVYSNTIVVTANSHDIVEGESIYLTFTTGDVANATSNFYNVYHSTANTFNIDTPNTVMTGGAVDIKTANITVTVTNHGFRTDDSIYMWFTSGDIANVSNGYYTVFVKDINTMYITDFGEKIGSNGELTIYRGYMNATLTRADHGYSIGDYVRVMFDSGNLANISNGIYYVNDVADSSTYNIAHRNIIISGNLTNLLPNNSGNVYVSKA
jgi:hypothetical protein